MSKYLPSSSFNLAPTISSDLCRCFLFFYRPPTKVLWGTERKLGHQIFFSDKFRYFIGLLQFRDSILIGKQRNGANRRHETLGLLFTDVQVRIPGSNRFHYFTWSTISCRFKSVLIYKPVCLYNLFWVKGLYGSVQMNLNYLGSRQKNIIEHKDYKSSIIFGHPIFRKKKYGGPENISIMWLVKASCFVFFILYFFLSPF